MVTSTRKMAKNTYTKNANIQAEPPSVFPSSDDDPDKGRENADSRQRSQCRIDESHKGAPAVREGCHEGWRQYWPQDEHEQPQEEAEQEQRADDGGYAAQDGGGAQGVPPFCAQGSNGGIRGK